MRALTRVITLVLIFALLATPMVALASSIDTAKWYSIITTSNNSTAADDVFATFPLGTQGLIDSNFLSANLTDCAMHDTSGTDTAFMPSVNSTYPWCFYVSSIGEDTYKNYILYIGGNTDMDGDIRYFPAAGGMTTADNATLELSDNFTIEQKGWVDTDAGADKNLVYKGSAFRTFVSPTVSENITAEITYVVATFDETLRPNAAGAECSIENQVGDACPNHYLNVKETPADDDTTYVYNEGNTYQRDLYDLPASSGSGWINFIKIHFRCKAVATAIQTYAKPSLKSNGTVTDGTEVGPLENGVWNPYSEQWNNNPADGEPWEWADIDALQIGVSLKSRAGGGTLACCTQVYVEVNYSPLATLAVTATGVESGNHTVKVWANTANLTISIDEAISGNLFDTTALTGDVFDNDNDWTFIENYSMPYMEYHKIWIDAVLQQHIEYEYDDTVFSDLSGQSHPAYPTFRTASSDADVSAVLSSWEPIEEAQAPAWVLEVERDFWDTENITAAGTFLTTPTPTAAPGVDIIEAISAASGTPSQLPFNVIAGFVILAVSLVSSWFLAKHGSRNLWLKIILITILMAMCVAVKVFDFWMVVFFLIMAIAVALFSRQRSTV